MKKYLYAFIWAVFSFAVMQAQSTSATLQHNNVKAVVQSNGLLFQNDQPQGEFIVPYVPGQPSVSALRAAGLWIGGVSPNGDLRLSAQMYNENGSADFIAGLHPVQEPFGLVMNKIWRVTREQIEAHLADFADNHVIETPIADIFGWPGKGNETFATYNPGLAIPGSPFQLAEYWDEDGTGTYNPDRGDFPVAGMRGCGATPVIPDEMLWFTFHDVVLHTQSGANMVNVEVQATVFVFGCQESDHPLNNTLLVHYRTIYRGDVALEDVYFGLFNDVEIGNPEDDFAGGDPARGLVFGYNGDNIDEGFYGDKPPVVGISLLRGPLNENGEPAPLHASFPFDYNASDPVLAPEYYNLLRGLNTNGTAVANNGFPYSDDPNNANGLSEVTAGNAPGNRRVMSSFGPLRLDPGAVNEMVIAYSFVQQQGATPLENLTTLYAQHDALKNYFDGCFAESLIACSPLVGVDNEPGSAAFDLNVMPNPASSEVRVQVSGVLLQKLELYDAAGREVLEIAEHEGSGSEWMLPVAQLPAGMYWVKAWDREGAFVAKPLIIAKR